MAGLPPVGDLSPQAGLDLLGFATAAVDLTRELPLLAGQGVKAGEDDDLPAAAALPDRHDCAPGRGLIVDLSSTVGASRSPFVVGRDGIEPPTLRFSAARST